MRSWLDPSRWSIAARLLLLALLPTALMLAAGNASMYWFSLRDATMEINQRGQSVAAALAEGSRYAVVSGNAESVERTVRELMAADPSLVAVRIINRDGRPIVEVESPEPQSRVVELEVPVRLAPLNVDTFDAAGNIRAGKARRAESPVGFVRVRMSADPIVAASVDRLAKGSALVLLATLASLGIALVLAGKLREPLKDVMVALRGLRDGKYDVQMRPGVTGELAELQSAVVEMARGLRITHEQLEAVVTSRTADLSEAMRRTRLSDEEKGRLIARGNELVEQERLRISNEIHDDLNTVLVSVRMQADALVSSAAQRGDAEIVAAATRIVEMVDGMYARARDIVRKLRPEVIDALGLAGAVEETVRHYNELDRHCTFALVAQPLPPITDTVSIAAYRMLQEALSNVAKHAGATHCRVTLSRSAEDHLLLTVEDDGRGFESVPNGSGLGLVGIRERVSALRGTFNIDTVPGKGARLSIALPINTQQGTNGAPSGA